MSRAAPRRWCSTRVPRRRGEQFTLPSFLSKGTPPVSTVPVPADQFNRIGDTKQRPAGLHGGPATLCPCRINPACGFSACIDSLRQLAPSPQEARRQDRSNSNTQQMLLYSYSHAVAFSVRRARLDYWQQADPSHQRVYAFTACGGAVLCVHPFVPLPYVRLRSKTVVSTYSSGAAKARVSPLYSPLHGPPLSLFFLYRTWRQGPSASRPPQGPGGRSGSRTELGRP
jgi:hypothetical protein